MIIIILKIYDLKMKGLTFAVAALAAVRVSAEESTNEAADNAYYLRAPGYPSYMEEPYSYAEPRFMESPRMRYVEPRYGAFEPHYMEQGRRYSEPRYEEP